MRGVPARHAALEQQHLRRLVGDPGACGDGLGQRPVRAHVDTIGRNAGVPSQEGFDLVQGRMAEGSRRAVLVNQGPLCLHQLLDFPLALHFLHAPPSAVEDPILT